ncbi:hypothetical protein P106B_75 [Rhizobium phage vB_RglS_P106B]|uniref:Uncharacterized protein n=1 Tax=Rhizobium phage vB_RglS_P106B TaxID=1458697 RepID=W6E9T2_9CAUD|nr:hypothetical protein P106B_75 [Rhizobium phage vB_RglS_P106B]AHJ10758.1 hypothetical protein P106B_75 [Rhizobium phage vB_RglS_P106B]
MTTMNRNEAIARHTEIRKRLDAIARAKKDCIVMAKRHGVEAAEIEWNKLIAEERALEDEFKAVSKFRPSI